MKLLYTLLFLTFLALFCLATFVRADPPRVTIVAHLDTIECRVPVDSLNVWLDVIVEDITGSGFDLKDNPQDRTSFSIDLPKPLSCPLNDGVDVDQGFVRAACELTFYDLLHGKMHVDSARTNLACGQ
jgi:hypothetical protein